MSSKQRKIRATNIDFSANDIEKARDRLKAELVTDPNPNSMFNVAILSILEGAERRRKAELTAQNLIESGFDNPQRIVECRDQMPEALYHTRWYNVRADRIVGFSEWWIAGNSSARIMREIIHDMDDGRKREFELRDAIAKEAPGMERKTASVFMIRLGYENLVPVDTHECKLLRRIGFNVKVPDYKTQSLPRGRKYIECERKIIELARGLGVTPAVFHHAVLNKGSRNRILPSDR
jgi:thermostable 8-oxoguanine DNA glycosylase